MLNIVMRRIFLLICCLALPIVISIIAQDDGDLVVGEISYIERPDPFRGMVRVGQGTLTNESDTAYRGIDIFADLYGPGDILLGEGFGTLVNACGAGLLPDFTMQPGQSQTFELGLEFFNEGTEIERVETFVEAVPVEATEGADDAPLPDGVRVVDDREVVNVTWEDPGTLRFGVGCEGDVFTNLDWFRYDVAADEQANIIHPNTPDVTEALLLQLGLEDPVLYNRSELTFSPTGNRIIYQDDINTLLTAEEDGSFKRLIYENLARFSLQGFTWLPEGRFLAYYYGAFGDPVRYFTASISGQRISADIYNIAPSLTVPGITPDGVRSVVMFDGSDGLGYYLFHTITRDVLFLFEAEPPGNNWPAPVYVPGEDVSAADIYIARPVDGVPTLQCLDQETASLRDVVELPLDLTIDDRAWMWLSPDNNTLALAASGVNGGLWLVGLASLGGCTG
jgi:hypothetical protein